MWKVGALTAYQAVRTGRQARNRLNGGQRSGSRVDAVGFNGPVGGQYAEVIPGCIHDQVERSARGGGDYRDRLNEGPVGRNVVAAERVADGVGDIDQASVRGNRQPASRFLLRRDRGAQRVQIALGVEAVCRGGACLKLGDIKMCGVGERKSKWSAAGGLRRE